MRTVDRRAFALPRVLAAFLAGVFALCLAAPAAFAAEGVTRNIAGVNFTVPADWTETVVEGIDVDASLSQVTLYAKEDGLLAAGLMPDADLGSATLSDLQVVATYLESYLEQELPFLGVSVTAGEEQGYPAITFYTDDMSLNGTWYALTVKIFMVNSADFSGGVVMMSLLPVSGQVTEGFADTLLVVRDEPVDVTVGGIAYTLPAGSACIEGSLFGVDFFASLADDGISAFVNIPHVMDDMVVTVEDLQMLADEVTEDAVQEALAESGIDGLSVRDFWIGAYEFLGYVTLGTEMTITYEPEDVELYLALMASDTSEGVTVLLAAEPVDGSYVSALLEGAAAVASPRMEVGAALSQAETVSPDTPGFTVGL